MNQIKKWIQILLHVLSISMNTFSSPLSRWDKNCINSRKRGEKGYEKVIWMCTKCCCNYSWAKTPKEKLFYSIDSASLTNSSFFQKRKQNSAVKLNLLNWVISCYFKNLCKKLICHLAMNENVIHCLKILST